MSRILLVDDSPHAQRMGERILSEEGYEVVTVSNADSALIRLDDVDPDVVIADVVMPGRTGYDICQYLKMSPRHRHVRVILTAGVLETLDEANAKRVESDGVLRKPFEASALTAAVKPLAEAATKDRSAHPGAARSTAPEAKPPAAPFIAVVDSEQVRAAVTVALDASMASMVDEITKHVLAAIATRKPEVLPSSVVAPPSDALPSAPAPPPAPPIAPAQPMNIRPPAPPKPNAPEPAGSRVEPVRRVNPLRLR
ncbi:MAG: response regulator receiver protein, partial [Candidatus Solibacter sp.]|nr:response regulator receiver protein [Candidatus Solibacter sp.]